MKIYLLRHGQTDANFERRILTRTDMPLNKTGIKHAEDMKENINNLHYDLVISSPLLRARQTAEIINKQGIQMVIDDRIIEMDAGILELKKIEEIDVDDFLNYNAKIDYEGAENIKEFCKRVWNFLEDIKVTYKDKTILIVTHNIVIRAIKAYIIGIPEDGNMRVYGQQNCVLTEYDL